MDILYAATYYHAICLDIYSLSPWLQYSQRAASRGWPKVGQRVPIREPESLKLIYNREPRSLKTGLTYNWEPNREVQAWTSWVKQEVIGYTRKLLFFYRNLLVFDGNLLVFTEKFSHAQLQLQFQLKLNVGLILFFS